MEIHVCSGNCMTCGKCAGLTVLDSFRISGRFTPHDGTGIAIDLGTTNVVMALLDLAAGRVLARKNLLNPQMRFGPDVISRIAAFESGHSHEIRGCIREAVTEGIAGLTSERPVETVIAGNTVMTRFFPALSGERLVPCLSEYVGGDVLAGLLYVLPERKGRFLFIDLGTNGEIAFYDNGKLTVTSAAAGPAFEKEGRGASNIIGECASLVRRGIIGAPGTLETRDLQLSKSAIRSGIEILLGDTAVDGLYLAGGIGQAMKIEDAVGIGLLPPELAGKACAVGNASLGGCARLLLDPEAAADMERLRAGTVSVNLAEHPDFPELFMKYMAFP